MPDKWGRITGSDWMQFASGLSTLGNIQDQKKTQALQNQSFQAQIDKNEQQSRINKGAGNMLVALKAGGDLGSFKMQPGGSPYEHHMSMALASQMFIKGEQGADEMARIDRERAKIAHKKFKPMQRELIIAHANGNTDKVHDLIVGMMEIANMPFKLEVNSDSLLTPRDPNHTFNTFFKRSGSDEWEETGTIGYQEIVGKVADMSWDRFAQLSSVYSQTNRQWNADAVGLKGVVEGGKAQYMTRQGKTYLVFPQRNPDNQNDVHYVVVDEENNSIPYGSKKDLILSGFDYEDLDREKSLQDLEIGEETIQLRKDQQIVALAQAEKAKRKDLVSETPSEQDLVRAGQSITNRTMNNIYSYGKGILKNVVTPVIADEFGQDKKGITVWVKHGSVPDFKRAIGSQRYEVYKGSMESNGEKGSKYLVLPTQDAIYKLGGALVNLPPGVSQSSRDFIENQRLVTKTDSDDDDDLDKFTQIQIDKRVKEITGADPQLIKLLQEAILKRQKAGYPKYTSNEYNQQRADQLSLLAIEQYNQNKPDKIKTLDNIKIDQYAKGLPYAYKPEHVDKTTPAPYVDKFAQTIGTIQQGLPRLQVMQNQINTKITELTQSSLEDREKLLESLLQKNKTSLLSPEDQLTLIALQQLQTNIN